MKALKVLSVAAVLGAALLASPSVQAGFRSYYHGWTYYPQRSYYYNAYYYQPNTYHYCIHYQTQPNYVYYYNPYSNQYWGRYDLEAKGYSLLAEKDRKQNLKEIPESAFPKPGKMPAIPDSTDGSTIPPPPAPPKDAPKP